MALPPVPAGYDSWNQYITIQAPPLMINQGLTFQEAKASIKLLDVAMPVRQALGTPSYRIYNVFTTWAQRTVAPTQGRPWRIFQPVPSGLGLALQQGGVLVTQSGEELVTN